jgi:hypothetical protein
MITEQQISLVMEIMRTTEKHNVHACLHEFKSGSAITPESMIRNFLEKYEDSKRVSVTEALPESESKQVQFNELRDQVLMQQAENAALKGIIREIKFAAKQAVNGLVDTTSNGDYCLYETNSHDYLERLLGELKA